MTNEEKISLQRAAIIGLLTGLLEEEQDRTMKEVKSAILSCLASLTLFDCMVGDIIDQSFMQAAKQHCEEELALEAVKEMLA